MKTNANLWRMGIFFAAMLLLGSCSSTKVFDVEPGNPDVVDVIETEMTFKWAGLGVYSLSPDEKAVRERAIAALTKEAKLRHPGKTFRLINIKVNHDGKMLPEGHERVVRAYGFGFDNDVFGNTFHVYLVIGDLILLE